MKALIVSIFAFALFATPAFAQPPTPTCPPGYTYATVSGELTACIPNAVPAAVVQAVTPAIQAAASAITGASNINYLPHWYGSAGGGGVVPGNGRFAYEAIAVYLGAQTYGTTIQEFTVVKGQVLSCTMAGVSKVLYQFGFASFGTTPLGGGCTSSNSGGGAAGEIQGFGSFRIKKTGVSIVATGEKIWVSTGSGPNDGRNGVKFSLGVSYGK